MNIETLLSMKHVGVNFGNFTICYQPSISIVLKQLCMHLNFIWLVLLIWGCCQYANVFYFFLVYYFYLSFSRPAEANAYWVHRKLLYKYCL